MDKTSIAVIVIAVVVILAPCAALWFTWFVWQLFRRSIGRRRKAHLSLLSRFLNGDTENHYRDLDKNPNWTGPHSWRYVLGEDPVRAVRRFVRRGWLARADTCTALCIAYTSSQLHEAAAKTGLLLPKSAKKTELADALVSSAPQTASRMLNGVGAYVCQGQGRVIAQREKAREAADRAATVEKVTRLLEQGNLRRAAEARAAYCARQVFEVGMGMDWKNYDYSRSNDKVLLEEVFNKKKTAMLAASIGMRGVSGNTVSVATALQMLFDSRDGKQYLDRHMTG